MFGWHIEPPYLGLRKNTSPYELFFDASAEKNKSGNYWNTQNKKQMCDVYEKFHSIKLLKLIWLKNHGSLHVKLRPRAESPKSRRPSEGPKTFATQSVSQTTSSTSFVRPGKEKRSFLYPKLIPERNLV